MGEVVYLNGSLLPLEEARISSHDYGFLYGYGLFETMRAYRGRVFRLDRHLDRMAVSADRLGMLVETPVLKKAVIETIAANRLSDARVRLTVSSGEGVAIPDPATFGPPTVLVVARDYQPFPEDVYREGFRVTVSSIRRNSQSPLSRMKSLSFLESVLARQEARGFGVDEALCLNERGLVAEASMSNLFLVSGGTLRTPGADSGALPGITREVVLELAVRLGIDTIESDITLDELSGAEEAFLTNSVMEIMPMTEVSGRPVGSGHPGPVSEKLMAAYRELVRHELG